MMTERDKTERRSYFRINDEVSLNFRVVSDHESKEKPGLIIGGVSALSLATEFEKMRVNSRVLYRHVEKDYPDVARYMGMLEDKLDMLLRATLLDDGELLNQQTQEVNLSGSGIAFNADIAVKVGGLLALNFILYPTLTGISATGSVISCEPNGSSHRIAVEFGELSEDDRDLLIRHIIKKQMDGLRKEA